MSFDLSEHPIDYTGIEGQTVTQWASRHRQLDTIPSVFGPYMRLSRPGGGEIIGSGVLVSDGANILLTRQNRWPIRMQTWEIPLGGRDPEESLAQAALRELFEETGVALTEADIVDLGAMRPNASTMYAFNQIYFARVEPSTIRDRADDEIIECAWVPAERVVDACVTGEVTCASTVVAVLRAVERGLLPR